MRRLEYVGGGSEKFWEGSVMGLTVTTRWGRLGTNGQTKDKAFASASEAEAHLAKLIAEKVRKGYGEPGTATVHAAPVTAGQSEPDTAAAPPADEPAAETAQPAAEPAGGGRQWADEDVYDPPSTLLRMAVARRGSTRAPRRVSDEAVATARDLLATCEQTVRAILADERTEPDLREAGLGQLAGQTTPLGAAIVQKAASNRHYWSQGHKFNVVADLWIATGGPAFAAEALMLDTGIEVVAERSRHESRGTWVRRRDSMVRWQWGSDAMVDRVRASLACADDDEYARAVAAVGALRDSTTRKAVAAYLLPTERAWVDEAVAVAPGRSDNIRATMLLGAVEDHDQLQHVYGSTSTWALFTSSRTLPTLVRSLGPAVTPALDHWLDDGGAEQNRTLLAHLASFPTDEAMAVLIARSGQRAAAPYLQEALKRFPRRGARMLAEALAGPAGVGDTSVLETSLSAHVLADPEVVDGIEVSEGARARLDKVLASRAERVPAADPADLPPVLADPPWLRKKTKAKPVVVAGLEPLGVDALAWADGERDEWLAAADRAHRPHTLRHTGSIDWPGLFAKYSRPDADGHSHHWIQAPMIALGPEDLARELLLRWQPEHIWDLNDWGSVIVARFGLDALPALLHIAASRPASVVDLLRPFTGPSVAALMADWATRLKAVRTKALAYLARHGTAAVRPLIPAAVGEAGRQRTAAGEALRAVAAREGEESVLAVAREYGAEADAATRVILAADPLESLPAKLPAVGAWANPALLPQILLADRRSALPLEAAGHVVTILALCKPGAPYAGLAQVQEATDPASLARFAWRLFHLWLTSGAQSKDNWAMTALGAVGDDEVVRELSPLIRAWPGEGGHARAVSGLDVLGDIGTDVALMHLNGIANKVKFKGLKERAEEKMRAVAERIGLSSEQLADRLVPDLGLDTDGSMVLDYGPRKFTVGFD
ncbi:WGR domain-containing protein, partial [Actinokineospora pegani]|uniref:WGR domain-containing protein n=1 Tax=Actinokineospora pegani TaxID=2654637 RepID=UPI0018D2F07E